MSGIDGVGGVNPPTDGPDGVSGPKGPDRAERGDGALGDRLKGIGRGEGTDSAQPAAGVEESARLERMLAEIRSGVVAGRTRDESRDRVIRTEVERSLGDRASPAVLDKVQRSFREDPQLAELFDQLYDAAVRGEEQ